MKNKTQIKKQIEAELSAGNFGGYCGTSDFNE